MLEISNKVKEVVGCTPDAIPAEVFASTEPVILKGLVKTWPLVQAGLKGDASVYIKQFYTGKPVVEYSAAPEKKGRYFYNDELSALDFESQRAPMDAILDKISATKNTIDSPSFYIGSTDVDVFLPGFRAENDVLVPDQTPIASIWIGNQSRIACHYDASDNIACVAVGRRRFTLFPPSQIHNLYPGPVDLTPSGQSISLVDFDNPDFEKFPRFHTALEHAQVANMEPGDALFLPTMWWHYVEGLSDFNVLVNYWWRSVPAFMGLGINALKHAMLSIRDLPEAEKAAWKHIFDYYIFEKPELAVEHIPAISQGCLAAPDDNKARQLRAWLVNKLNR